jgi:hypothetical protein
VGNQSFLAGCVPVDVNPWLMAGSPVGRNTRGGIYPFELLVSVEGLRDHGAYLSALKCHMGIVTSQWMIPPRRVIRGGLKSAARKEQPLYWLRVAFIGSSRGYHQGNRTTGGEVFTAAGAGTLARKELVLNK